MNRVENFDKMLKLAPRQYSGLTLCQGNFSLTGADTPALIDRWGKAGHINFVDFRNVQDGTFKFTETFRVDGQIDMYIALKAYNDIGFQGTIRPDQVPAMAGEENTRPGDLTIGGLFAIEYRRGLMKSISKSYLVR